MPWLIVTLGYFLGAVPTAYIAGRWHQGKDIRQLGDGNVGSANAFRQLGARVGVIVGVIDIGKGALAVLIAQAADVSQIWVMATGVAAVIGHNWPVFIGFRGGRGVSVTAGVLYVMITQPMLIVTVPTFSAIFILRDVSKAIAIGTILLLISCWWLGIPGMVIGYGIALLCLVAFTHFIRTRQPVHISGD